mgnify:CR=1 FL=1
MIKVYFRLEESVPVIKVKGQIIPLDETGTTPIVLQIWHDKDPSLLVVHRPKSCCPSTQCCHAHMGEITSSETLNNRQTKLYISCSCFTSRSCLGEEGLQLLIKVQSLYPGKTHNTSLFYFIWYNNRLNIKSKPSIDLF